MRRPRKLNHDTLVPGRTTQKNRELIHVRLTDEQLAWLRAEQLSRVMSAGAVIRACMQAAMDAQKAEKARAA